MARINSAINSFYRTLRTQSCARAIGEGIFTQGDTWEELREMVLDATKGHFYDSRPPEIIRLHLLRDEVVPFREPVLAAA
jgi:hypothetical protein